MTSLDLINRTEDPTQTEGERVDLKRRIEG